MCAIRRGCCEGRVPEKCLKIIGARAAVCECVHLSVCGTAGVMGDRDVKEERCPGRRVLKGERKTQRHTVWLTLKTNFKSKTENMAQKGTILCDQHLFL